MDVYLRNWLFLICVGVTVLGVGIVTVVAGVEEMIEATLTLAFA